MMPMLCWLPGNAAAKSRRSSSSNTLCTSM
jgi:hypothetical protein